MTNRNEFRVVWNDDAPKIYVPREKIMNLLKWRFHVYKNKLLFLHIKRNSND